MSNNFYLARQPILDREQKNIGYELLYRDSAQSADYANERHATAALLVNVLNQAGLKSVVGEYLAFVNIDDRFLRHEIIDTIPAKTFIYEITDSSQLDALTVERIEVLYNKGYEFCLDASTHENIEKYSTVLPYLSYCKIDTFSFGFKHIEKYVETLHQHDIRAIATKVETESDFQIYKGLMFDAFQGYYFAEPKIIQDKKLDADQKSLFKLCNLLQGGGSIPEIVESFEKNPSLTLQLLRFMNSAAFSFKQSITSIGQIITLLGRNPLNQWLMLLLYSKSLSSDGGFDSPLIVLVKQRTNLLVSLTKMIKKDYTMKDQSEAYFVGILSLLDTLLHISLHEIFKVFSVDENIQNALFKRSGDLGELFSFVLAIENFDTEKIDMYIQKFALNKDEFAKLMLENIQVTVEFEQTTI